MGKYRRADMFWVLFLSTALVAGICGAMASTRNNALANQTDSQQAQGRGFHLERTLHIQDHVRSLLFSPDGRTLAVSLSLGIGIGFSWDRGRIVLWDTRTWRRKATVPHGEEAVGYLADGRRLVVRCWGFHAGVWDPQTNKTRRLPGSLNGFKKLALSSNARTLVAESSPPSPWLHLWDLSGKVFKTPIVVYNATGFLCLSNRGDRLVTGGDEHGEWAVWETKTGKKVATWKPFPPNAVFTPGDNALIGLRNPRNGSNYEGLVQVRDTAIWKILRTWKVADPMPQAVLFRQAVSPRGDQVALECNGSLQVWNWRTGQRLWLVSRGLYKPLYSPTGDLLAAKENYIDVLVLRAADGQVVFRETRPKVRITSVCFSSDGRWFAVGDYEGMVKVWRVSGR